jgi:hypothetical protein
VDGVATLFTEANVRTTIVQALLVLGISTTPAVSFNEDGKHDLAALAEKAASGTPGEADAAIRALREAGQPGLDALHGLYRERLARSAVLAPGEDAVLARIASALDAVGQQKDCASSRLFWHTDLEAAKAAARREGKPILSLRLLGNLSDELSCANSRFFRTALYANAEVSTYLRSHYILHWQSVRPVPVITIDFGDGRRIERTITGNSIHYVLAPSGEVVDAIPGLYGPGAFLRILGEAEAATSAVVRSSPGERASLLRKHHEARLQGISSAWLEDARKAGLGAAPPALGDDAWKRIAALHAADAALDRGSVALMASKNPGAAAANRLSVAKRVVEDPFMALVRSFEASMAEDTVRNEYLFRTRILDWLAKGRYARDVDRLNEAVYAELFLTPSSDPWLGLAADGVYTALPSDGIREVASPPPGPHGFAIE